TLRTRFIPTHVGNTRCGLPAISHCSVHPHACGEHLNSDARRYIALGSSPRMWGTQKLTAGLDRKTRFIPTHVGNTVMRIGTSICLTVHPHACGEHPFISCL